MQGPLQPAGKADVLGLGVRATPSPSSLDAKGAGPGFRLDRWGRWRTDQSPSTTSSMKWVKWSGDSQSPGKRHVAVLIRHVWLKRLHGRRGSTPPSQFMAAYRESPHSLLGYLSLGQHLRLLGYPLHALSCLPGRQPYFLSTRLSSRRK